MRSASTKSTASLSRTATACGGRGGVSVVAGQIAHGAQDGTARQRAVDDEVFVGIENPAGQQGSGGLEP